jgi:hypothetical protein
VAVYVRGHASVCKFDMPKLRPVDMTGSAQTCMIDAAIGAGYARRPAWTMASLGSEKYH